MSIQPKWCELIAKGEKTKELRKTAPALKTPFKCYIYCTKDELLTKSHYNGGLYVAHNKKSKSALERAGNITFSGKVIGEFVCNKITYISPAYGYIGCCVEDDEHYILDKCCLTRDELCDYGKGKELYSWRISELKIYDEPKELSEFRYSSTVHTRFNGYKEPVTRPPQSWCYVEEL